MTRLATDHRPLPTIVAWHAPYVQMQLAEPACKLCLPVGCNLKGISRNLRDANDRRAVAEGRGQINNSALPSLDASHKRAVERGPARGT
jgi:hypothetical protein